MIRGGIAERLYREGVQERVERNEYGRTLISGFILLTLVAVFTWNLPGLYQSELKAKVFRVANGYVRLTGLQQTWSVFAPETRRFSIGFHARILYADGSEEIWRMPSKRYLAGDATTARWRRWQEVLTTPGFKDVAWNDAARWLARTHDEHGKRAVRVTFVKRARPTAPPGSDVKTRWREEDYYTYVVRKQDLGDTP